MTELAAPLDVRATLERALDTYRVELTGYCYRMLGSAFDAEDAVQETLVRAWRHVDRFEGRSSIRSWLYRIATNVCLDALAGRARRALPVDLAGPGRPDAPLGPPLEEQVWVGPVADGWVLPADDPADQAVLRDSVRLAFVAALQLLPARQRAALILRDVLAWRPAEIAALLDTTTASVNSALQRARSTLASVHDGRQAVDDGTVAPEVVDRYVRALEQNDVATLVALLHDDATLTMPPFDRWFRGPDAIGRWMQRKPCGDARYLRVPLNGGVGLAGYRVTDGDWRGFGVQLLEGRAGAIVGIHTFLDERLVTRFGLPATLPAA